MDQPTQVAIAKRLLQLRQEGRDAETERQGEPFRNPVSDYTSTAQLGREVECLFRAGALLAGLSADVPAPGDWLALDVAGTPVLLVRGRDGMVRAFANACRHRGAPVCSGHGAGARRLVCPYHGWSYELTGALAAWSHRRGFEGLDPAAHGLVPLPVAEAHGLVYVRPRPGAEAIDLETTLSGVERELAPLALGRWARVETREIVQRMNWKLVVDTFLESYHLPILHRQSIAPFFEGSLSVFDAFGRNGRLAAARRGIAELGGKPESEWSLLPHATIVYQLFPNAVLIYQQDHVELWQVFPAAGAPDAARMRVTLYAPEPPASESAARHWKANMDLLLDVTTGEDFALAERMQVGFQSRVQEAVVYGRNEPGLAHYHRAIREALDVG